MERKENTTNRFLESEGYLSLKKELGELLFDFFTEERNEDIKPLADEFDNVAAKYGVDATTRNKLFWGLVSENIKGGEFNKIHTEIGPLLEDASRAEAFLNKRLNEIIKKLSPTIYRSLNSRGDAFGELKAKFYSYFPEIKDLIVGELTGKKPEGPVLKGELGQDPLVKAFRSVFEEGPADKKEPAWLLEKDWDIPNLEDIKPGLVVEILDIDKNMMHKYLILSYPYLAEYEKTSKYADLRVETVEIEGGGGYKIEKKLSHWGLAPSIASGRGGEWSPNFKPIKWYPYYESSKLKELPEQLKKLLEQKNPDK